MRDPQTPIEQIKQAIDLLSWSYARGAAGADNENYQAAPLTLRQVRELRETLEALLTAAEGRGTPDAGAQKCDCGRPLTQCSSCAVEEWQMEHPDCRDCCPIVGAAVRPSPSPDLEELKRLQAQRDRNAAVCLRVGQILGPNYDGVSFEEIARELVALKQSSKPSPEGWQPEVCICADSTCTSCPDHEEPARSDCWR